MEENVKKLPSRQLTTLTNDEMTMLNDKISEIQEALGNLTKETHVYNFALDYEGLIETNPAAYSERKRELIDTAVAEGLNVSLIMDPNIHASAMMFMVDMLVDGRDNMTSLLAELDLPITESPTSITTDVPYRRKVIPDLMATWDIYTPETRRLLSVAYYLRMPVTLLSSLTLSDPERVDIFRKLVTGKMWTPGVHKSLDSARFDVDLQAGVRAWINRIRAENLSTDAFREPRLYTAKQAEYIYRGLKRNIDVSIYNDPNRLTGDQMEWIYLGLVNKLAIHKYAKEIYNPGQMQWVYRGLYAGIAVEVYNDPTRYTASQMFEVYMGLTRGVDVSLFNDPDRYKGGQMRWIREALQAGIDPVNFNNPKKYNSSQMEWIFKGKQAGIDTSVFDNPDAWRGSQMKWLCMGLIEKLDVTDYLNTELSPQTMRRMYHDKLRTQRLARQIVDKYEISR